MSNRIGGVTSTVALRHAHADGAGRGTARAAATPTSAPADSSGLSAAQVRAETAALRTELAKAGRVAVQAGLGKHGVATTTQAVERVLNAAETGTSRGKFASANDLLTYARGAIAGLYTKAGTRAERSGNAAVASRATQGSQRASADATPGQGSPAALDDVTPQGLLERTQQGIAHLQSATNRMRQGGMNTGHDLRGLDRQVDIKVRQAQRFLDQGRIDLAQRALQQGRNIVSRGNDTARNAGGTEPAVSLRGMQASYRQAMSLGGEQAGKQFALDMLSKVNPDAIALLRQEELAPKGQAVNARGEIARALDESGDTSSVKAQLTRLFLEQGGAQYNVGSERNSRERFVASTPRSVDDLFNRAVNIVGGHGASQGDTLLIGAKTHGTVRGTMFDDTVIGTGPLKNLRIDTREGNDQVIAQGDLKNVKLALGRGDDTAQLSGTFKNVAVSGDSGRDAITLASSQARDVKLDAGSGADQVQLMGNFARSNVQLGEGNDVMSMNVDPGLAGARAQDVKIVAGNGRYEGDDEISLGGEVKNVSVNLSELHRDAGNDVVQLGSSLKGDLHFHDTKGSSARYNYEFLEHNDGVVAYGDGWSEQGDAHQAGNALVRRGADGKVQARVTLGDGPGDGHIEQIQTVGTDGKAKTLRDDQPELFAKPMGVTVGEWAMAAGKAAITTAMPGAGVAFSVVEGAASLAHGDVVGGLSSLASAVSGGLNIKAGDAVLHGATQTAKNLSHIANTIDTVNGGINTLNSLTHGKLTPGKVLDALSYASGATGVGGSGRLSPASLFGDAALVADSFGPKGHFHPTGLFARLGGEAGGAIGQANYRKQYHDLHPMFGTDKTGLSSELNKANAVGRVTQADGHLNQGAATALNLDAYGSTPKSPFGTTTLHDTLQSSPVPNHSFVTDPSHYGVLPSAHSSSGKGNIALDPTLFNSQTISSTGKPGNGKAVATPNSGVANKAGAAPTAQQIATANRRIALFMAANNGNRNSNGGVTERQLRDALTLAQKQGTVAAADATAILARFPRQGAAASASSGANSHNVVGDIISILQPDALVVGETHPSGLPWQVGRGGTFGLITPQGTTFFGAQYVAPLPPIPTPFGIANGGVSVVGTANDHVDEAGMGISYKFPTPVGDVLVFINGREDGATVGAFADALSGKTRGTLTVSINLGFAYSASDGASLALGGPAGLALANATGVDAFAGFGWRAKAVFENGQLKSVNIGGVDIPIGNLAQFIRRHFP